MCGRETISVQKSCEPVAAVAGRDEIPRFLADGKGVSARGKGE